LIQDVREPNRYLTLDFWAAEPAYEAFREKRRDDYKTIDARCGQLTEGEREVGRFSLLDERSRATNSE